MSLLFQYSFMMVLSGMFQAGGPLPRTPIIIGPFAATCSTDAKAACESYRHEMQSAFPHARFIGDCYATMPLSAPSERDDDHSRDHE